MLNRYLISIIKNIINSNNCFFLDNHNFVNCFFIGIFFYGFLWHFVVLLLYFVSHLKVLTLFVGWVISEIPSSEKGI